MPSVEGISAVHGGEEVKVVRVWLPPTFAGVDPEAQVSARVRQAP